MTRNDKRLFIVVTLVAAPLIIYAHQTHCFLRGEFRSMAASGGWGELKEFHFVRPDTLHEQLKGKLAVFKYGVNERHAYYTIGPFFYGSSRKDCFIRRYFTEVGVYDGPTNPNNLYQDRVPQHVEALPLGLASEICFLRRSDGNWDIQGRMLSEAEGDAEKGSILYGTFSSTHPSQRNDVTEFRYQTNRGKNHERDFVVPDEGGFWADKAR
jgi:hypothetical protein